MCLEVIVLYTISGCTGVGKTTLIRKALEEIPNTKLLRSHTTREPRENDLAGAYAYLGVREWRNLYEKGDFVWFVQVRDRLYGTRRDDLRSALTCANPCLAAITPDEVPGIYSLAVSFGLKRRVCSVYILSPEHHILVERLTKMRGLSAEQVAKNLLKCRDWDEKARSERHLAYHFIHDRNSLSDKFTDLRTLLLRT